MSYDILDDPNLTDAARVVYLRLLRNELYSFVWRDLVDAAGSKAKASRVKNTLEAAGYIALCRDRPGYRIAA